MASTQSTITLQNIVDVISVFGDIRPILLAGGYLDQPMLTIANDVMNAICGVAFPHKWNEMILPPFYTNSFQQDYAGIYPDGSSVVNLAWLQRGMIVDINNNSNPKPYCTIETGRQLQQATGSYFYYGFNSGIVPEVNFFPNNMLYYGIWGDAITGNATFGNNPVAGSVYLPLLGASAMPNNPIMQIQDANGNYLFLTGFGTEGSTAPLAPPNAAAGTIATPGAGATTTWTVLDPYGQGFRILPVPSSTGVCWQWNLIGQMKPVRFTSLSQTLFPLLDQYESDFRAGCIAQSYRYSQDTKTRAKFKDEWALWLASLTGLRSKQDREQEENKFTPERGIMGGGTGRQGWAGGAWPFRYPVG